MEPACTCLASGKLEGLLCAHAVSLQQAALQLEEWVILRQSHLCSMVGLAFIEHFWVAAGHWLQHAPPHGDCGHAPCCLQSSCAVSCMSPQCCEL